MFLRSGTVTKRLLLPMMPVRNKTISKTIIEIREATIKKAFEKKEALLPFFLSASLEI